MRQLRAKIEGKELISFCIITMILLFVMAFSLDTPADIGKGMITIILSRDTLITDYFELASYGAAFFNAALVMGLAIWMLYRLKMHFTGLTMAVLFINVGFALFGKNPFNVIPIIIGTWLYAKVHKVHMSRYIYTALFGSCLSPLVTEMGYLLPFSYGVNLLLAIAIGIFVGFILPPLAQHTASMHMGYNLLNMGFAAGLLAFVIVCILQSHGLVCNSVFIWKEGRPLFLIFVLYGYFLLTVLYGFWINGKSLKGMKHLLKHPGRAVADFVMMDGEGLTLINMGFVGILSLTYILLIKGDLSGPVIGTILTAYGFAAFGVHIKNFPPVLMGVYLSTFFSEHSPCTPGIQLAAIFSAGLAPVAGQFGIFAGIIAGMMHASVAMCTSSLYGGLNLYNNGFSTGLVAIVMVPMLESFMKNFHERKNDRKAKKQERKSKIRQ